MPLAIRLERPGGAPPPAGARAAPPVRGAFETWADTVAYEMEESRKAADRAAFHAEMQRAEELRHKQVMASSVHHIMKRGLSKCFASWLGWVTEKVAVRNMLRKTVLRIQNM